MILERKDRGTKNDSNTPSPQLANTQERVALSVLTIASRNSGQMDTVLGNTAQHFALASKKSNEC